MCDCWDTSKEDLKQQIKDEREAKRINAKLSKLAGKPTCVHYFVDPAEDGSQKCSCSDCGKVYSSFASYLRSHRRMMRKYNKAIGK